MIKKDFVKELKELGIEISTDEYIKSLSDVEIVNLNKITKDEWMNIFSAFLKKKETDYSYYQKLFYLIGKNVQETEGVFVNQKTLDNLFKMMKENVFLVEEVETDLFYLKAVQSDLDVRFKRFDDHIEIWRYVKGKNLKGNTCTFEIVK